MRRRDDQNVHFSKVAIWIFSVQVKEHILKIAMGGIWKRWKKPIHLRSSSDPFFLFNVRLPRTRRNETKVKINIRPLYITLIKQARWKKDGARTKPSVPIFFKNLHITIWLDLFIRWFNVFRTCVRLHAPLYTLYAIKTNINR